MYAIIRQGGKQYRVAAGDEIVCEKVGGNKGDAVRFDKVLLVGDDDKTLVGHDDLAKYDIKAELVENFSEDKVLVFKYKAKKGYRQKNGHRQQKSRIKIVSIGAAKAPGKKTATIVEPEKATEAPAKKASAAKAKPDAAPPAKAAAKKSESKKPQAKG